MVLNPKLEAVAESFSAYTPSKDREEILFSLKHYIVSSATQDEWR